MINKIKGAIFDMDGTLINSLIVWDVIWEGLRTKYSKDGSFKITTEDDKTVRTMTLLGAMEFVHKKYGLGNSPEELLDELNRILLDFYSNVVEVKEGVTEFLDYCLEKGIKMCIASATDVSLLKVVIEKFSFDKYFSDILSCADIGKGKNEPDVFLKALETLGTDISETCVFEDSQVAIETAHKAGFMTVGIFDRNNYGQDIIKKTADVYIDENENLLKLIQGEML